MSEEAKSPSARRRQNHRAIRGSAACAEELLRAISENPDAAFGKLANSTCQLAFELFAEKEDEKKIELALKLARVVAEERRVSSQRKSRELEREKWEFDVARTCHAHMEALQEILGRKDWDEQRQVEEFRKRLFGQILPG